MTTSNSIDDTTLRFQVTVEVPAEHAFRVFTERFDEIKPRDHNLLAPEPIAETVFETYVGGHVYDRGESGTVCRWARVLAYEPPSRLVISWDIGPRWQVETDPARTSEVEVTFAEHSGRTTVTLEHRHLDRHGDGWESMLPALGHDQGWPLYLDRYLAAARA